MKISIYARYRFHPDIIKRAVWMYFRFNLSFRVVEELITERGVDVPYETMGFVTLITRGVKLHWLKTYGQTGAVAISHSD